MRDSHVSHTHLLWSIDADLLLYILDLLLYILDLRADKGEDRVIRLHVYISRRVYTHVA